MNILIHFRLVTLIFILFSGNDNDIKGMANFLCNLF